MSISRRNFIVSFGAAYALSSLPVLAKWQTVRPPKRAYKHYFAFDTGLYSANKMHNVKLQMATVEKDTHNPLFIDGIRETPAKMWEPRIDNGYPNVILDDKGIYHCYYTLFVVDPAARDIPIHERDKKNYPAKDRKVGLAYARSQDGITWEKPSLGLVEFEGSRENNLLMRDVAGTGVLFEPNEPDPTKRFKLITRREESKKLAVAFSEDGIHFSDLVDWSENSPEIGADCHNSVFRDSRTGQYILTTRLWASNFRVIAQSRSEDFIHWSPLEEVLRGQGYEEQVYSMTVFEQHDLYLGLASVYRQGDNSVNDFDTLNLELYWSTNLTEWNKAVPEHNILIPSGAGRDKYLEGEFDSATIFASAPTAGEGRLYYTGGKGRHRGWRDTGLGLAYIKPNQWAGMVARQADKPMDFATNFLKFHDETLEIWADIGENGELNVSLDGIEGFEAKAATLEKQESGAYRVSWQGRSLVEQSALQKRGVSVRIQAQNTTFWGISGGFEMDESRYWAG